jgi:hypothetical protein
VYIASAIGPPLPAPRDKYLHTVTATSPGKQRIPSVSVRSFACSAIGDAQIVIARTTAVSENNAEVQAEERVEFRCHATS